jgi:hypothetical protein
MCANSPGTITVYTISIAHSGPIPARHSISASKPCTRYVRLAFFAMHAGLVRMATLFGSARDGNGHPW